MPVNTVKGEVVKCVVEHRSVGIETKSHAPMSRIGDAYSHLCLSVLPIDLVQACNPDRIPTTLVNGDGKLDSAIGSGQRGLMPLFQSTPEWDNTARQAWGLKGSGLVNEIVGDISQEFGVRWLKGPN
ncbi:MAG TPA: hypothetical protein VH042_01020 [Solirubrobacterales bacterium]|jgi:hypothetical protein|nr:hypothetical protein [Solirubrobacterales bacterium]